jgi:hypothetical protein
LSDNVFFSLLCSIDVITVDSSTEEEKDGDCFSEEDWSVDGCELKSDELMNQVESDERLARFLQEEINGESHNSERDQEMLVRISMRRFLCLYLVCLVGTDKLLR